MARQSQMEYITGQNSQIEDRVSYCVGPISLTGVEGSCRNWFDSARAVPTLLFPPAQTSAQTDFPGHHTIDTRHEGHAECRNRVWREGINTAGNCCLPSTVTGVVAFRCVSKESAEEDWNRIGDALKSCNSSSTRNHPLQRVRINFKPIALSQVNRVKGTTAIKNRQNSLISWRLYLCMPLVPRASSSQISRPPLKLYTTTIAPRFARIRLAEQNYRHSNRRGLTGQIIEIKGITIFIVAKVLRCLQRGSVGWGGGQSRSGSRCSSGIIVLRDKYLRVCLVDTADADAVDLSHIPSRPFGL